jgi:hypothetical protein
MPERTNGRERVAERGAKVHGALSWSAGADPSSIGKGALLKTLRIRASVLAATFAGILIACAAGSTDTIGDGGLADGTGTGDGGGGDGSGDTGSKGSGLPIGSACESTSQCASPGTCTALGSGHYCTEPCPESDMCPTGTYCSIIDDTDLCVPDLKQECLTCTKASDCKLPSDACLTSPQGDSFCARDCTPEGDECPTGFTCVDKATYAGTKLGGGSADAGTSDGGATDGSAVDGGAVDGDGEDGGGLDSGGDADDSGMEAGTDAGMGSGNGPSKWCVPIHGASCTCDAERNGLVENCSVTNKWGTCTGQATCIGATGKLQACNAQTPSMEICNGVDDNCNGQIDEGDPNSLCSFMGGPPANSSWVCMNGACSLGPCAAGFTAFPPGPLSQGCNCAVNAGDADGLCDMAIQAGSVSATTGSPLVITGTLSSATAVAVYHFTSDDSGGLTNTNPYHVSITFTQPTTNTEFVMDVIRGATCSDAPVGATTDVTSYDWCVDATSATAGEAPCGPTAVHHCTDESSDYYIRVYRAAGVTPTCTTYELTVSGNSAAVCDLTQSCM